MQAIGENGRSMPIPITVAVIISIGKEARLWGKGTLAVRMTWTITFASSDFPLLTKESVVDMIHLHEDVLQLDGNRPNP